MKKAALYARVSTENQSLERQEDKLTQYAEMEDLDYTLFSEKASSVSERPQFEEIMSALDDFDAVIVTKIDRFARSIRDFNQRIQHLRDKDTEFVAVEQPVDTSDEVYGDFMLKQLALFAELERKMIRRRLEEGHKEAMEEGRVGRPRKIDDETAEWLLDKKQKGAKTQYLQYLLKKEEGVEASKKTIYNSIQRIQDED